MTTLDANRVILTEENSVIRLNKNDSDAFTTNATSWRILSFTRDEQIVLTRDGAALSFWDGKGQPLDFCQPAPWY